MKKVYCKKNLSLQYENRNFHQYKTYYIDETTEVGYSRFILIDIENKYIGRWFNNMEFDEYFTFDQKILRQEKLERILDDSIL